MENKYEQKDMTGTLWMDLQTKQGKDGSTYECYTGSAMIHGVEHWVNGYPKTLPSGKQLISLAFKPKQQKTGPMSQTDVVPKQAPKSEDTDLSSIPF